MSRVSSLASHTEHGVSSVFPAPHPEFSSDRKLQRARGFCRMVLGGSQKGTRIVDVYQQSPIRILFPRTSGVRVEEAVLLNTAGGVAGGDWLETNITAMEEASIAVTTQAAERVYRALAESAHIVTTLKARDTARLAWLPQETIVFNRARVSRVTHIDISSGVELLALEWLVLGRAAYGETLSAGKVTDHWRVVKDGKLVWADGFRITDEVLPHISRKALLSDCTSIATLIYSGTEIGTLLALVRDIASSLPCNCAATLVSELMIVRFAARTSYDLRTAVSIVLAAFGGGSSQSPFRVPRMWSC
jgi:urease accessory protein